MPPGFNPESVLHYARDNNVEALQIAANIGADLQWGNRIGQTALHIAALRGHVEAVTTLLGLGCDPNVQNEMQQAPLHFAANAHGNVRQTCLALIEGGADLFLEDMRGTLAYENAESDDIRELLGGPSSRLFEAAAEGDVAALRELLPPDDDEHGDNPAPFNGDGLSTVHLAASGGHVDALGYLLARGAFPNQQDLTPAGDTAAHHAVRKLHAPVLTLLASRGADLDTPNFHASQYAQGQWVAGGKALGRLHQTPLHVAVESGDADMAETLLALGSSVNVADFDGRTPLHYAIEAQDDELTEMLLKAGADPNRGCADFASPMHLEAQQGATPLLRLLLQHGGAANSADKQGWTPLMLAARNGKTAAVKVLAEAGADVLAQNTQGASALHLAAANGRVEVCRLLLKAGGGVAVKLQNAEGKLAAEVAKGAEVVQLLEAAR